MGQLQYHTSHIILNHTSITQKRNTLKEFENYNYMNQKLQLQNQKLQLHGSIAQNTSMHKTQELKTTK